jgi:hypothetical protein
MAKRTISITRYDDDENETEITVEFEFTPGAPPHFSRDFGNWLPADPPSFDVVSAVDPKGGRVDLSVEEIEDVLIQLDPEDSGDPSEDYADEKYDQRRDDIMTGDYDRFDIYDREE